MAYENVRSVIKAKGLSIRKVALSAGMAPQSLYAALNEREAFWPGWRKRVAEVLEIPEVELFNERSDDDEEI